MAERGYEDGFSLPDSGLYTPAKIQSYPKGRIPSHRGIDSERIPFPFILWKNLVNPSTSLKPWKRINTSNVLDMCLPELVGCKPGNKILGSKDLASYSLGTWGHHFTFMIRRSLVYNTRNQWYIYNTYVESVRKHTLLSAGYMSQMS